MGLIIGNPEVRYYFITKWMEKVVPGILNYGSKDRGLSNLLCEHDFLLDKSTAYLATYLCILYLQR